MNGRLRDLPGGERECDCSYCISQGYSLYKNIEKIVCIRDREKKERKFFLLKKVIIKMLRKAKKKKKVAWPLRGGGGKSRAYAAK